MYSIPGDNGHPWRLNKFAEYHSMGDFDMNFPILIRYANKHNLSMKNRLWMSFLYSTCYCVGTTVFLFKELPLDDTLTPKKVKDFWSVFKAPLIFQTDRRYVKNMDWFVPLVSDWMKKAGRNPVGYFKKLRGKNPHETYINLYKEVMNWRYFGRFTTFLFIEAVIKLTPIKANAVWFDWKKGNTATSGALHILYLDEEAEAFDATGYLETNTLCLLEKRLPQITRAIKKQYPQISTNITDLETSLCGFRKLFKGTRYGGYYIDRVQDEIIKLQANLPDYNCLWEELWVHRLDAFSHQFLGEVQGYKGIQKHRCKEWLERGAVGFEGIS